MIVDAWTCPACRSPIEARAAGWACDGCDRVFPVVAGLPDLRLASDRYLSLEGDRAKARGLASLEGTTDFEGLARRYYDLTADVDGARRARYLAHLAHAEARGDALATHLPREGRILEVGCGSGGLLAAALRRGMDIRGADVALRWLVVARRRLRDIGLDAPIVAASAERLPWPDATFDALVADSLLEHLDDPAVALREFARVLKPGGELLAWSPNRFSIAEDPHVGLLGVGWLPRGFAPRDVCAGDDVAVGASARCRRPTRRGSRTARGSAASAATPPRFPKPGREAIAAGTCSGPTARLADRGC